MKNTADIFQRAPRKERPYHPLPSKNLCTAKRPGMNLSKASSSAFRRGFGVLPSAVSFPATDRRLGRRAERARRERHGSPPRKAPDSDDAPLRGAKTSFISGRLAAAGKRRSRRKHGPSSADSPKDSIPGSGGLEAASGMKTSLSPCPGAPCPARRQQKSPSEQNPTGLKGGAERLSAASWRC